MVFSLREMLSRLRYTYDERDCLEDVQVRRTECSITLLNILGYKLFITSLFI